MIDLIPYESLKNADLEALLHLQEMLIKIGLDRDSKVLTAYLKVIELKTKLLGYEFDHSQKVLTAYKRISEKLLIGVSKAFDAKTSSEALVNIAEALSDFSTQIEVSLFEAGYSVESHSTLKLLRDKLRELETGKALDSEA
jgi:GTP-sensing pleiotropic transcriptional regulator CodY